MKRLLRFVALALILAFAIGLAPVAATLFIGELNRANSAN